MFRNVVVGVDGRPAGRDAIALGRQLAAPDGRLTLAHVREVRPIRSSVAFGEIERDDSTQLLEAERETAAVDADVISMEASSVGRGLHHLVEAHHADLLVVGSCSRGFIGRVLMGNDTRASLNGASSAVAVAPLGYAYDLGIIATIGVGYDGSPESGAALELARDLARQHGASLRALEVVQIPTPYPGMAGIAWADALDTIRDDANKRVSALAGVEGEAVLGLAGEELAAFGGRVSLLVVGSRSYGPLRRLMLGSTSAHLAAAARCPLLVLPRAASRPGRSAGERRARRNGNARVPMIRNVTSLASGPL